MVIQIRDIHTHIHTVCIDAYSCIFYISIYLHIIRCIMCTYYIHIHYMDNKMCFSFGRCFAPRSSAAAADASRPAPSSAVAAPLAWALNGWCQRCVCVYIYTERDAVRSPFFHVSENAMFLLHPVRSFMFIYLLWYY